MKTMTQSPLFRCLRGLFSAAVGILGFVAGSAVCAADIEIPPPPAADWQTFPEMNLHNTEEARDLFSPMSGSEQVTLYGDGDRRAVYLPCNFEGTDHDRASWDVAIQADLAVARGIQFYFYCADAKPIASFAVYFHSGDGWYRAGLSLPDERQWHRIIIDKSTTGIEENPAGWGQVDTIRISAWRGKGRDTACAIAAIGPIGTDADILVLRADSAAADHPNEAKSFTTFAETVSTCLARLDIPYAMLSDLDVTAERLRGRKLVILPYNPSLPDGMIDLLAGFVKDGGRIMTFYSLVPQIADLLQVERGPWVHPENGNFQGFASVSDRVPGFPSFVPQGSWNAQLARPIAGKSWTQAVWRDHEGNNTDYPAITASETGMHISHVLLTDGWEAKKTMMLAMVGFYVPGLWERAAKARFEAIGHFAEFADFDAFRAAMSRYTDAEVRQHLDRTLAKRKDAQAALAQNRWPATISLSAEAANDAVRTWCVAQHAVPDEHRAFWCHSAFGLNGKTWDEAIAFLARHGFNAILPNMLWGGVAFYPSEVLPVYSDIDTKGDQIQQCLDACRRYNVECHIWKVNFNMGSRTPREFVDAMNDAGRVQVSFNGEVQERWLCPSNPENQDLEIRSMVEIARNYAVDGLHFDYIRYPGRDFCFCEACRKRFEAVIGKPVANWPEDVRETPELETQWLDFRRNNITRVVSQVARRARAVRPGIRISAAVFRNWPIDRDGVGQDWKLWCDRGYLDEVCPMDYTASNSTFENMVSAQLEYAGKVPCYPGIGLSTWSDPHDAVRLIQQIEITRRLKTGGFTVFNYDSHAVDALPFCALGATAK
jgi:uncharacterized lipoprotein YddW (UPF0748 family)